MNTGCVGGFFFFSLFTGCFLLVFSHSFYTNAHQKAQKIAQETNGISQYGKDGPTLMSWIYQSGWVIASLLILANYDSKGQVNLVTVLPLMLVVFMVGIAGFYYHTTL